MICTYLPIWLLSQNPASQKLDRWTTSNWSCWACEQPRLYRGHPQPFPSKQNPSRWSCQPTTPVCSAHVYSKRDSTDDATPTALASSSSQSYDSTRRFLSFCSRPTPVAGKPQERFLILGLPTYLFTSSGKFMCCPLTPLLPSFRCSAPPELSRCLARSAFHRSAEVWQGT